VEVRVLSWAPSLTRTGDGFQNIEAAVPTAAFLFSATHASRATHKPGDDQKMGNAHGPAPAQPNAIGRMRTCPLRGRSHAAKKQHVANNFQKSGQLCWRPQKTFYNSKLI